jgi:arylsulfatase A-like enzyme
MTGMYPSKHGIHNNVRTDSYFARRLNSGCETFSQKLKDAGYNLAYTGKWHVSAEEDPSDFGWEELEGVGAAGVHTKLDSDIYFDMLREDNAPRGRGEVHLPGWGRRNIYKKVDGSIKDVSDYKNMQHALKRLAEFAKEDKPWCLFISLNGPHGSFDIPEPYASMYDPKGISLPENYMDNMDNRPELYKRMQKKYSQLSEDEVKESIAYYWGYCSMMDDMFGEALAALDKTGQADDTLVIRLSDHGEYAGNHGLYAKGIPCFDEAYRYPLIMRYPNGIKNPGRMVDEFVTHCDISPTLTELAGAESTCDPSGKSLLPFLNDEPTPADWPDAFYNQCNGVEIYFTQRMVRTKKYKLVYNPASKDELYDLENDPHEMTNLIDDPNMQHVIKKLFVKIWKKGREERDYMSAYHTISHAPFGPAFAFGKD